MPETPQPRDSPRLSPSGDTCCPLFLITSLFSSGIWRQPNDILIPHLKRAFGLTDFQSSLSRSLFLAGYFIAALPAGWLMERIGYKRGILTGLVLCAAGALPVSSGIVHRRVSIFSRCSVRHGLAARAFSRSAPNLTRQSSALRTAPSAGSTSPKSFNAVGSVVAPLLGRALILSNSEYTPAQIAAMSAAQLGAYRQSAASTVRGPYLGSSPPFS